ncbi:MAG: hypothetical protein D6704_11050 [Nitrospirae bacterium]|nr:MAG: hypothetical protein D6704_11050 [Nitrospirota bacterium]
MILVDPKNRFHRRVEVMHGQKPPHNTLWSLILAGGEGTRMHPLITSWIGIPLPKQYCTFLGTRSLLQHTWDRADQVSAPPHKITVVAAHHYAFLGPESPLRGQILFQPKNCGTGPGVYSALAYLKAWNPQATVIICPCDHAIFPENRFCQQILHAVEAAEQWPHRLILFGHAASPTYHQADWVVRQDIMGMVHGMPVWKVQAFDEAMLRDGSHEEGDRRPRFPFVVVAKVDTVWRLGWRHFPQFMHRAETLRVTVGTPHESYALHSMYRELSQWNFVSDFLMHIPEEMGVLDAQGLLWSDWDSPEDIVDMLRALNTRPTAGLERFIPQNGVSLLTT